MEIQAWINPLQIRTEGAHWIRLRNMLMIYSHAGSFVLFKVDITTEEVTQRGGKYTRISKYAVVGYKTVY